MNEENKIGYYAIIPATVLFNEKIKANEKLLYAIITVLSNKEGYCYASNGYLGRLLNAKPHTVSKWVSHLKELEFVCLDMIRNDKGEIIQRRIYPNDTPYTINRTYPYSIERTGKEYNNINLTTYEFQAPKFYEKCGFEIEFIRKDKIKNFIEYIQDYEAY